MESISIELSFSGTVTEDELTRLQELLRRVFDEGRAYNYSLNVLGD